MPIASQSSSILGATTLDTETQQSIAMINLEKHKGGEAKESAKSDAIRRRNKCQQAKKLAEQQQQRQKTQWLSYKDATLSGNMEPVVPGRVTIAVRQKRKSQLAITPDVPCIPKCSRSNKRKEGDRPDRWETFKTRYRGY